MNTQKIVYQGKIIEVIEEDVVVNGNQRTYEFARRAPGTRTIVEIEGDILLTREHRHEVGGYDYRLPGGKVFDKLTEYNEFLATMPVEADELTIVRNAAVKELKEEVGIIVEASMLKPLHKSICGTTVQWDLYYFAVHITPQMRQKQELGEDEDIEIARVPRVEARQIALSPKLMSEDRSAVALLRYLEDMGD